jgi:transcriptional regulator
MSPPILLVKGSLDALVLRALVLGPLHGFDIATWLEERAGQPLEIEESALYQALRRLEERQLIASEWRVTPKNRQARYYRLTPSGRAHLKTESKRWLRYADMLRAVLGDAAPAR